MQRYLIMCRSLTYAQRSAKLLERSGITAVVVKAPTGLSKNGCGYCVSVSSVNGANSVELLDSVGFLHGRVFIQNEKGVLVEARV